MLATARMERFRSKFSFVRGYGNMTAEYDRFKILFDRLAHLADACVQRVPEDVADWIPVVNSDVRYGDRITQVTIRELYVHMVVSERDWLRQLQECDDGGEIVIPQVPELTKRISTGDYRAQAMQLHEANMATLESLPDEVMQKFVSYTGRTFTGMGFLWAMYAHRSYHLGNIDIYMRQGERKPPDFFDFEPPMVA